MAKKPAPAPESKSIEESNAQETERIVLRNFVDSVKDAAKDLLTPTKVGDLCAAMSDKTGRVMEWPREEAVMAQYIVEEKLGIFAEEEEGRGSPQLRFFYATPNVITPIRGIGFGNTNEFSGIQNMNLLQDAMRRREETAKENFLERQVLAEMLVERKMIAAALNLAMDAAHGVPGFEIDQKSIQDAVAILSRLNQLFENSPCTTVPILNIHALHTLCPEDNIYNSGEAK